ncbi:MAG: M3 family oligoendopeptidase [Acidobacteriota bacterium]|nr:M3 family oligoendopeptidase [Acidobacteriota bacterium]
MSTTEKGTGYRQTTWSLSGLLPNTKTETISSRLQELEALVSELEAERSRLELELEPSELRRLIERYEAAAEKSYVLSAYGSLWFASDTQDEAALTYSNRMDQVLTGLQNRLLFFTLWWKDLDDDAAERLLPAGDDILSADYRHFLRDLRRLKDFTLDEPSERIVNLKDANGIQAVLTLYSMLTNRLEFELDVDGETKTLSRSEVSAYFYSPDADRRESAYHEIHRVYEADAKILGQIYVNRVRDWASENLELRGFGSPIAVRNLANDIPDDAVEALLGVCTESAPIFQRYFRLKAKWLGLEKLRRYDLYAPLAASDRQIPYEEGVETVLETFDRFHLQVGSLARRVFDDDHIDSELRKGKKGGAFCATVLPSQTPWILLNYTGKVRDVATLAHELGHAVHSLLAEDHSVLTQHASLPLAETASVFAEQLLTDRLLAQEQDPVVRRELLAASMDDIYATVLRQAYFVRFEIEAHRAILEGQAPEALHERYFSLLEEQFGGSVELANEFRYEWVSIPHIYQTPFYCYAYSFGQLLVLALYRRYQEQGEGFVPGYLRLLAHGGSARPQEILSEVGVDVTDPEFWRGGFRVVEGIVDELESL